MKRIFYIVLTAATLLVSATVSAQEANKDLLIGPGSSNWFLSFGGGVNAMYDARSFSKPENLSIAVNLGKWFTPAIGFRAGYVGLKDAAPMKVWFAGTDPFNYNLVHLDAMWNMANTANYKLSRVWNPILYFRGGAVIANYKNANRYGIAGGFGLQNQFRLGNHVSLAIDLSAVTSNGRNFVINTGDKFTTFLTGTVGLVFDLGKRGFNKPIISKPDTRAIDELRNQLRTANSRADEATRSAAAANAILRGLRDGKTYLYNNGTLSETIVKEVEKALIVPEILYFDLGKATLTGRELARLEYYAENTFKKDQKLLVTGCADLGTGTREANDRLSKQRAEYVKSILVNQFGYKAENIETKADVMPGDAPIKGRIVTIEVQ